MMPIGDDNSDRLTTPYVNYAIIALNVLVFVIFQQLGNNQRFDNAWSSVPAEIASGRDVVTPNQVLTDPATGRQVVALGLQPTPISVYLTLITSIFMHGSIAHIGGNMLFLYIFGDNVEDRIGHMRYVIFYLLVGVLASLANVMSTFMFGGDPLIPSLGASGAISGILGAYLLLFPQKQVRVIVMSFMVTSVPAIIAVGLWFVLQFAQSLGFLGASGGVAYAAHVGGFIAGLLLIKFFTIGTQLPWGRV